MKGVFTLIKKLIALLLAAVFAAVSLAACEPKGKGEDTSASDTGGAGSDTGDTGATGGADSGTSAAK